MSSQFNPQLPEHPKVLVTGASGFVGSHLAEALSKLGCDLYLLLRPTSRLNLISELKYTPVTGSLGDLKSLEDILPQMDYIFHSAGLISARSLNQYMVVNRDGTANLLEMAAKYATRLKRFVLISSQAAAGPSREHKLRTEADAPTPVSDYGASKLAGEEAALAFKDRIPITIIRPPAVFGPRDTDVFVFFKYVKLGWMLKFGGKEGFVSLAYVRDVVDGTIRAAFNDKAAGETFFITSVEDISQWEVQQLIADTIKVDIRPLRIPVPILKLVSSLLGSNDGFPLKKDKVRELEHRYWVCSSAKARALLNYEPTCSLQQAIADTYQWYQDQGWL